MFVVDRVLHGQLLRHMHSLFDAEFGLTVSLFIVSSMATHDNDIERSWQNTSYTTFTHDRAVLFSQIVDEHAKIKMG